MLKTVFMAFDLDGTLLDNERALREAYRAAGVHDYAPDGLPVGTRCTPEQHSLKQALYPQMLRDYARPGPALPLWDALRSASGVQAAVLTGASERSARDALAYLGENPAGVLLYHGATHVDKAHILQLWQASNPHGRAIYVDACSTTAERVSTLCGCGRLVL